ncbi:toxin [Streptomyces sp. NPDC048442]|uniref:toxin n=1 Tax=Streptomyces sp. NPDC048442 TaxID=3154823 RepID=UPI00344A9A9F
MRPWFSSRLFGAPGSKGALRRRCERLLAEAGVPDHCSVDELCDHLSKRRERPIALLPMQVRQHGPGGLWLACAGVDVILYDPDTSRSHQNHIVTHELAHILCEHRTAGTGAGTDDHSMHALFPDLDPELVRGMLGRSFYTDPQEREAEMIASLILKRARPRSADPSPALPGETAAIIRRIERTIGRS